MICSELRRKKTSNLYSRTNALSMLTYKEISSSTCIHISIHTYISKRIKRKEQSILTIERVGTNTIVRIEFYHPKKGGICMIFVGFCMSCVQKRKEPIVRRARNNK